MTASQKNLNMDGTIEGVQRALDEVEDTSSKLLEKPIENLDKLDQLLNVMEEELREIQGLKERIKNTKTRLKKTVSDIDAAADAYGGAFLKLWEEKKHIKKYLSDQNLLLDTEFTGEKKAKLDEEINNAEIGDPKSSEEAYNKAKDDYQKVKDDFDKKQKEFDALKTLHKTLELKLKEMSDFKTSIADEAKKENKEDVYFLIKDKGGGLETLIEELDQLIENSKLTILSADTVEGYEKWKEEGVEPLGKAKAHDQFKNLLNSKWKELIESESKMQAPEKDMKEAEKKYQDCKKAWEELQKNRKTKILEKYKDKKDR